MICVILNMYILLLTTIKAFARTKLSYDYYWLLCADITF